MTIDPSAGVSPGGAEALSATPPPALVRAIRRVLRPLVRLLLHYQITFPYLAHLLKNVYVEVAEDEFAIDGKPQTTSRISLLTGIHRKDVRRLREEPRRQDHAPPVVSLGAQLVARWTGVARFLDESGHPLPLARLETPSGQPSFDELVASVSKDIRPRSVLDEWLRLGVVELTADDMVRLVVDAFVPSKGFEEKSFYLGRNIHDHLAATAHNLTGGNPPLLERSVYYGALPEEAVAELRQLAEQEAMAALQRVNRRAQELRLARPNGLDRRARLNFGVYFYREDEPPEEQEGSS